ncbi:MAG TPA: DUF4956 domain-containing protein [Chloroflexota bacterium]|nr:DUF4956 domain-containing protein [Chloroflexota bacterium]
MHKAPGDSGGAVETETAKTDSGDSAEQRERPKRSLPPAKQPRLSLAERIGRLRHAPFLLLAVYYTVLIALDALLVMYVPAVRQAFVEPGALPAVAQGTALIDGVAAPASPGYVGPTLAAALDRALVTLLVILGALSLVVPVAWVYMYIKRLRYDPALVRSVIILPIVVAGIALVVKNSLALAFSLAGIVAAVRFRNTLKDPRDAVYIFLTIGIGLSAGVQAVDVALVVSLVFNFVVLFLWKYNIGSIYGGRYGRTGVLSVGTPSILVAQAPEQRKRIRTQLLDAAEEIKTDGILLVHSTEPELARHVVQEALSDMAKDWRLVDIVPRGGGVSTLQYLVRLKKKTEPAELVGALDDRWSSQVEAAEYVPFRTRQRKRTSSPFGEASSEGEA